MNREIRSFARRDSFDKGRTPILQKYARGVYVDTKKML